MENHVIWAMAHLSAIQGSGPAATAAVTAAAATGASGAKPRNGLDRATNALAMAAAAVAASLSDLHTMGVDPALISRLSAAAVNHGVAAADRLAKLPGELEHVGSRAVEAFLNGGEAPHRAADAANWLWDDGAANIRRGTADMGWLEQLRAGAENHLDGLIAAARTPEFWQRTLGNAVEASVYAAAITAVDQLLVHRDSLLNGSATDRKESLLRILQTSGLMAAGALPVSAFLAVALMLVPGLTVAMGPLGLIGAAGLGLRLISSVVRHPSQQERQAARHLRGLLQEQIYALQRDSDGHLTITVQAQPAS
jgi:hypothetical protein